MRDVSFLNSKLDEAKQKHFKAVGQRETVVEDIQRKKESIVAFERRDIQLTEEMSVVQKTGARQLQTAATAMANAATYSIQNILEPDYLGLEFEITSDERTTKAVPVLKKVGPDGTIYSANPYEDNGGGVNDIISISLKLAALSGYQPTIENALLLDEPSKHLSKGYRDGLSLVLRDLSNSTNRQVIAVTQDDTLAMHADNKITFE